MSSSSSAPDPANQIPSSGWFNRPENTWIPRPNFWPLGGPSRIPLQEVNNLAFELRTNPAAVQSLAANGIKGATGSIAPAVGEGAGPGFVHQASDFVLSSALEEMLQNLSAYSGDGTESPESATASLEKYRASRAEGKSAWEAFVEAFKDVNTSIAGVDAPTEGIESNPAAHLLQTRARVQALTPSPEEQLSTQEQEQANNTRIENYCEQASRLCTMRAVDNFFRIERADTVYSSMITKDNGREAYRGEVGGFWGFFVQIPYFIFFHLISPIITQTIETVASKMRQQLKEKDFLKDIVNEEIGLLSSFFGEVDEAREEYLDPALRTQKLGEKRAGSFQTFLEETTKVYGEKSLTEEQLLKIVQKHIIDNYVPRPNFSIQGLRIPIVSTVGEWCVWKIRRWIINKYLKHTHQLTHWLNQGTKAISYARLSMEKLFCEKLSQACLLLEKAEVERLENGDDNTGVLPTAVKTRVIAEEKLNAFGQSFVRYLKIRENQGSMQSLRNIDPVTSTSHVSSLLTELFSALKQVMPVEAHTIQELMDLDNHLAHATGHVIEDILEQLFDDADNHVENQLQNIFTLLTQTIDGSGTQSESIYEEECAKVHSQLISLIEQLSQLAVKKAVDHHLEDSPKAQLKRDHGMVESVKAKLNTFVDSVRGELEELKKGPAEDNTTLFERIQTAKNALTKRCDDLFAITTSEEYRKSLSKNQNMLASALGAQLSKADKDFVGGLKGVEDIYLEDQKLNQFKGIVDSILENLDKLKEDISLEDIKEIIPVVTELFSQLPPNIQEEQMPWLKFLFTHVLIHSLKIQKAKEETKIEILSQEVDSLSELQQEILNLKKLLKQENAADETLTLLGKIIAHNHPQLSDLPSITEDHIAQLKKIFLPAWYSRQTTPLSPIHRELTLKEKDLEEAKKPLKEIDEALSTLETLVPQAQDSEEIRIVDPETDEPIEQEKLSDQENLVFYSTLLEEEFVKLRAEIEKQIPERTLTLPREIEKMERALNTIHEIAESLEVKKLVVVGEEQTKKRAPLAEKYISGEVHKKIKALVDALEDDHTYRQLFIRMVLVPIAKRQEVAV